MGKEKEFHPGRPPEDPKERITGLNEAIEAIKKRIEKYRTNNWDASVLETHLRGLENQLDTAKRKLKTKV